jgi:hypothetical protein
MTILVCVNVGVRNDFALSWSMLHHQRFFERGAPSLDNRLFGAIL